MPNSIDQSSPFVSETSSRISGRLTSQLPDSFGEHVWLGNYRNIASSWLATHEVAVPNDRAGAKGTNEVAGGTPPTRASLASDSLAPTSNVVVGMQKWAGEIISVEDGILTVELFPLDHDGPIQVADFDLRLLAPDTSLARPGGIVYLTTRSVQDASGYIEAMTNLRLRRPRRWSAEELSSTKRRARERAKVLSRANRRPATG